jgi:ACS family hexuronate transporter-like MFS transporter
MADRAVSAEGSLWRWGALALVFFAALLNYADRQILAILKPTLEEEFNWTDRDYGHMSSAFQLATMFSLLAVGWFVDRVGLRWGYAWGVGVWSLAGMAHAVMTTVAGFIGVRSVLAIAEAVNLPAAVKTVSAWFPGPGRSLALGIMNTAPNIGAVLAPIAVPLLAGAFGWHAAFVILGALGGVWLLFWFMLPRAPDPGALPGAEARQVAGGDAPNKVDTAPEGEGLLRLLRSRFAWSIALGKFLTDFVWVFLLFWAPDFFNNQFGMTMHEYMGPLTLVYGMAAFGALFGGSLSGALLQAGRSFNLSRKGPMMISVLLALSAPLAMYQQSAWGAALVLGTVLLGHQIFSTNMFGLATDLFPPRMVGRVMGLGGTFGAFSGFLMMLITGNVRDSGGSYEILFWMCAGGYAVALTVVHLLVPNIDKARTFRLAE